MTLFPDELQLDKKLEGPANAAAADPSRDVPYETMIVGLLTKQILPDATVLAFSRNGNFMNKEYLRNKADVYSFKSLSEDDVTNLIEQAVLDEEKKRSILEALSKINKELKNQVLFVKEFLRLSLKGETPLQIRTLSDLFLYIILGNLQYQNPDGSDCGFTELPPECTENLIKLSTLCKDKFKKSIGGDSFDFSEENKMAAGLFKGTKNAGDIWKHSETGVEFPLVFLMSVGIFEVPPSDCGELTLTARHLSFIEFFAAAGILQRSDIKSELEKITINRYHEVSIFMRYVFPGFFFR